MVGEERLGQQTVGDVLREVVVHRQLLQDDLALVVDVAVPQRRRGEHITEELDGQRQVLGRHPAVVRGVLLGREGVDVASLRDQKIVGVGIRRGIAVCIGNR